MSAGAATFAVRVRRKWREAQDIVGLELVAPDDGLLPAFEAGASIDVELPIGVARSYSIASDPRDRRRYLLAVLRDPASLGGSIAIHDTVREGDVLQVQGPHNEFPLVGGAVHSLLLAGGIGITPLLSMAQQLHRQGSPFTLHYAARSGAAAAFDRQLKAAPFAAHVHFHYGHRGSGQRLCFRSVLTRVPRLSDVYVCGPQRFLCAAFEAASAAGWSPERLHAEAFQAVRP